jgi:hypothetical protein
MRWNSQAHDISLSSLGFRLWPAWRAMAFSRT